MRIMTIMGSLLIALCALPVSSAMAYDPVNLMIKQESTPQTFHLFNQGSVKIMKFNSARTVRFCAKGNSHVPELNIAHDGKHSVVKPGECNTFTARNFDISPDGTVKNNYDLEGTVEMQG